MSHPGDPDAARLLRAYQAQEQRFVERRFPLEFAPEVPAIRELYSQAKGFRWNPETDIPWDRFEPVRYAKEAREAARRTWSRRAWGVYPGLMESTALLIRFCLESGTLGMDTKLFLSFRPAEEAKHLEVCHLLAERLGGYEPDPGEAGLARASNHPFAQAALDADVPVEAYIAALGALDDQLDLNLYLSHLQQARDEVVRTALRLIAGDRQRHVAFAWTFLGSRVPGLDARGRASVVATVHDLLGQVILAGYRNTWLLPAGSREPWLAAEEETARQGLGASTVAQERSVLRATVAQVRERLAAWRLALPRVTHPELGTL
ncbi:MAG: ferritin-like domain-containing protein [Candidatus Rokubacteria bacterium]|nr:ferritin-like domain-containing protein [Candidatus Rokubacteria bacterium]